MIDVFEIIREVVLQRRAFIIGKVKMDLRRVLQ